MLYALVSFLGLILGYILASKTKEELTQGKKYFIILSLLMLLFLLINLVLLTNLNLSFLIALILGLILNYFIKRIYLFLGLALINEPSLLLSLVIFIFGLSYGTLDYIKFKKISYKNILINFILFIIPLILLLFKDFTNLNIILGFSIGGILIGIREFNPGFKKEKRTSRSR